jgi:N-dimethylarginine dimethylaminohydrolase
MARHFGQEVVALELATEQSYHLDVCFCPWPVAKSCTTHPPSVLPRCARIRARVPAAQRIEATEDDLRHFSVNAVNRGDTVVMTRTTPHLRTELGSRGYRVLEVDLSPYMMSGGGAYCMTLRLDRVSTSVRRAVAA